MGTNGVGDGQYFPTTAWSLVVNLGCSDEQRAEHIGRLFTLYHGAILAHLRRTWRKLSVEDIEDRAGAFFARLLEKDVFHGFDGTKSRFRTFLKMLLDRFVRDVNDSDTAVKRGGRARHVSFTGSPTQLEKVMADHDALTPEEILDEVVTQEFLARGVERLRAWAEATGRLKHFEALRRYALEPKEGATYASVAQELGLKESDVRNYIFDMRGRLEQEIKELLKPTLQDPDRDVDQEFQDLFGRR
jgi:DNA-directed RNA polymerase specialized sigma24 family protein